MSLLRILFVCSRNQWRSPTAERMYRNHSGLEVRSAGTAASARRRINRRDLIWADLVVAMEHLHLRRLRDQFPDEIRNCDTLVLEIPDDYPFMHPDLIERIEDGLEGYLDPS